jgi:hypothetical protein
MAVAEEIVILVKAEVDKAVNDLQRTETQTNKTADAFSALGKLLTRGAIIAGVKKLADGTMQLYNEFADAELASIKLGAAVKNAGQLSSGAEARLGDFAQGLQKVSIYEGDATTAIVANLAAMGRSEDQIKSIISAASDLASATGQDLDSAVSQLNATLNGSATMLGRQNGAIRALTKEQLMAGDAIKIIADQYKGFAEQVGNSAAGAVSKFKNEMGDLKENMGEQISIFMKPAIESFTKLLQKMNESAAGIKAFRAAMEGDKVSGNAIDKALLEAKKQLDALDGLQKLNKNESGDFAVAQAKNIATEREKILVTMRALVKAQADEMRNAKDLPKMATNIKNIADETEDAKTKTDDAKNKAKEWAEYIEKAKTATEEWKEIDMTEGMGLQADEFGWITEIPKMVKEATESSGQTGSGDTLFGVAIEESDTLLEKIDKIASAYGGLYDAASGVFGALEDLESNRQDKVISGLEAERDARKANGEDTIALDTEIQAKKNEYGKKAFDSKKLTSIAEIAINTAKAAMEMMALPPPYGEIAAAAVVGMGATQAGLVAAQQYVPMATGGIVNRPTHILAGEGGAEAIIPLRGGNKKIGGDTIITMNVGGSIVPENYLVAKTNQAFARANRGY